MKRVTLLTVVFAAAGALIGAPMGVVGYGSGWGGAFIFGPLGAIIGFLAGVAIIRKQRVCQTYNRLDFEWPAFEFSRL